MRPLPPVAGVIGWPVAHSKSPLIHRFWLDRLGIDGDYGRFPVEPEQLGKAIAALPALGLRGVNVTVPHKQAVIPFLDRLDMRAAAIGAVNTVVVEEAGRLTGYNSDADGFLEAVLRYKAGRAAGQALVIGAGGAAQAVAHALAGDGFAVHVVNRDPARARALVRATGGAGDGPDALYDLARHCRPRLGGTDGALNLLVNTTTLGMKGAPPLDMVLDDVASGTLVYDIVYAPLETPLLAEARRRGLPTVDGLEMLIGQAAIAFELFYGQPAPRDEDAALRRLLTA
ncbi:MAG TPA: shikimate dehydrogenase [Sphingomonadaceae bacterium]|nr:shikimate dehydrogenase [Sphingomonadaceae bacterium]